MAGGTGGAGGCAGTILDGQGCIVGIDWQLQNGENRQFDYKTGKWATVRAATIAQPEIRAVAIKPTEQLTALPVKHTISLSPEFMAKLSRPQPGWLIRFVEYKRAFWPF